MITNFISMNGYGLFVWLSFGIVFLSCSVLYLKTRKTLRKYEKEFLAEFKELTIKEKKSVLEKSKITNQILATTSRID
ncbi:MAG: heme exporter protein CcmD [Pelagibacteraceae bacterium TMED287]|nr:MAG: heme exporter protein CcmD [Pelagibacteraceae bacterium TMED287]|tara:strand:+ start:67 stop:300 length:234 start_codon:yes stop_codon:yes gene_type:complete